MTENFDLQAFSKRYREELLEKFRFPRADVFEREYGQALPPALHRLYALGENLINVPMNIQADGLGFWIQCIFPLSPETVALGARYDWKFFAFAKEDMNMSLLVSVNEPKRVFVDHQSDGQDIEESPFTFEQIVDGISGCISQ